MKLLIAILLLPLLAGCAAALAPAAKPAPPIMPTLPVDAVKARVAVAPAPVSPFQVLVWQPNYMTNDWASNEVTVIIGTTDLSVPRSLWPVVFRGRTNSCSLLRSTPQMFYTAYNTTNS